MMRYLAIILLLVIPTMASGAPVISSATGNGSVSISGSGFGVKSPASPLVFETFEGGTNGGYLSTDADWPAYDGGGGAQLGAKYSSGAAYSGAMSAYNYVESGDANDDEFGTNYFTFSGVDEIYYSYVNKHIGIVGSGVYKNARINTGTNRYSGDGMMALSDNYVFYLPDSTSVYPSDDNGTGRYYTHGLIESSNWTRHQLYIKASNPSGSANGHIFCWVGGEEKTFANIVTRASGYSFQYSSVLLGLMYANVNSEPAGSRHDMYIDDVYVDKTLARIELCSGSSWNTRGTCNPQPPTAWSDTSISATLNTGAWSNGQSVYAYVVDSTGAVNSTGYGPITLSISSNASPQVSITSPTSASTYSTATSSIDLGGSASDSDGTVSSVTWACPTCTPTSGSATGTTPWTISGIGLAEGSNVITVTATDNEAATGSDSLTVTYVPPGSITCYLDADGDGYGTGISEVVSTCSADYYEAANLTATSGDCNDSDALIYPGSGCGGGRALYSPTMFAPVSAGWMSQ